MRHDNLSIIETTDAEAIAKILKSFGLETGHFTNGVYGAPAEKIIPTILTGFEYFRDRVIGLNSHHLMGPHDALVIAVNSDKSMDELALTKIHAATTDEARRVAEQERDTMESAEKRILKLAEPMALQHPDRNVVLIQYDQETPYVLYDTLHREQFGLRSIFKWGGYGANAGGAIIEGSNFFTHAVAFPFYNKDKPYALDITRTGTQKDTVPVVNVHGEYNQRRAYLTSDNKILFGVHPSLADYAVKYEGPWPSVQWSP